jgi:hypothetical protein
VFVVVSGEKRAQELEGGSYSLRRRLWPVYKRTVGCPTIRREFQNVARLSAVLSTSLPLYFSTDNSVVVTADR